MRSGERGRQLRDNNAVNGSHRSRGFGNQSVLAAAPLRQAFGRNNMIAIYPIGCVMTSRIDITDDDWGSVESRIELSPDVSSDALAGIESFSHVEIVFHFDRVAVSKIETGSRHPRNNPNWPKVGIFAQRGKNRPNRIGVSTAKLLRREDRAIVVRGLDAINGTPVLDIKPVMREFLPREPLVQPDWSKELMQDYWQKHSPGWTGLNPATARASDLVRPTASLSFRLLQPGDSNLLRAMRGLFIEAFDSPFTDGKRTPSESFDEALLGNDSFVAIAALMGGVLVGALTAHILPNFISGTREVFLYDLATSHAYRHQGVATALIRTLQSVKEALGASTIFVQAHQEDAEAVALYSKYGEAKEVFHFDLLLEPISPNKAVDSTATRVTPPASSLRSGQESRHGQP